MTEMRTPSTPFSNGTEYEAWNAAWCAVCAHDHGVHDGSNAGPLETCQMIGEALLGASYDGGKWRWPEAWTPEPPGMHGLPSYMLCGQFSPCTQGACTGDPAPDERAERVTKVQLAWRATR